MMGRGGRSSYLVLSCSGSGSRSVCVVIILEKEKY